MMPPLYFSRARLRPDPAIAAIGTLLLPTATAARAGAAHQLVWSLFAGDPGAKRDFLWREDKSGTFYILSARPPAESPVFEVETKAFAPELKMGDRLRFSLRANATRSFKAPGAKRGKRADVVMAELNDRPQRERAERRPGIILSAGRDWLATQGARHGFSLTEASALRVEGYDQLRIARAKGGTITISVLEFEGVLQLSNPPDFMAAMVAGFGHAKAFGYGLMLIRRA